MVDKTNEIVNTTVCIPSQYLSTTPKIPLRNDQRTSAPVLCYHPGMEMLCERTALILHGHFYQPPRENPLVDIIPKQSSAKPFMDWNERIFDDCYSINAFSRYLSGSGRIEKIIDNYEYLSFNFGPTLLIWLKKHHPDIHDRIVEADRLSMARLGHGNAMAQAFNHTILPLASIQDAKTQILWGIDDFTHRFGRQPEGMWLPEAAINPLVVDLLVEAGLRFAVLSPWQVESVEISTGNWRRTDTMPVPYDNPFLIEGSRGGTLNAFFYHQDLASGISFGHLLRDADALYDYLLSIKRTDRPSLIHAATDGEIYGHHEPFGDMALAALVKKVADRTDFTFTNYATYLENHQATLHARLHTGEEGKGSSWSCPHGVSRWYKDCGCHTGGDDNWNQAWRTPLRMAFDQLAEKIDALFIGEIERMLGPAGSPWELLRSYAQVISGFTSTGDFIDNLAKKTRPLDYSERARITALLAGQKFKHFCYTSCGWFFMDIGGIEPRQNIRYALSAIDCYKAFTEDDLLAPFLANLRLAKSNRRADGTGENIARSLMEGPSGIAEASGFFLINRRLALAEDFHDSYGQFSLEAFAQTSEEGFSLDVEDTYALLDYHTEATVVTPKNDGYLLNIRITDHNGTVVETRQLSNAHIPYRAIDDIFSWIDHSLNRVSDNELRRIATDIKHYSLLMRNNRMMPKEPYYIENLGTCLRCLRSIFTTPNLLPWASKRESICQLLEFIIRKGHQSEIAIVTHIFSTEIDRVSTEVMARRLNYERGSYLLDVLEVARSQGLQPSITLAQNALYPYIIGDRNNEFNAPLTRQVLDQLAVALNFAP